MKKDSKTIDKKKCSAWCDLLIALMKMTKEINHSEAKYIRANFSIAFANLELQELEKENKLIVTTTEKEDKICQQEFLN